MNNTDGQKEKKVLKSFTSKETKEINDRINAKIERACKRANRDAAKAIQAAKNFFVR